MFIFPIDSPKSTDLSLNFSEKSECLADTDRLTMKIKANDSSKGISSSLRVTQNGVDSDKLCQSRQNLHADKMQIHSDVSTNGDNLNKINKLETQQCQDSGERQPLNQFTAQHEHHTSTSFANSSYAAFKKGNVVRGILCPSLTNSFR
jgi:hypothetical protein